MAGIVIAVLLTLWLLGVIQIPGIVIRDVRLFIVNGHWVTLLELLIFIVMLWAIDTLPTPLREIGVIVMILWILSVIGVITVVGLQQLLILAVVVGLGISYFMNKGGNKKNNP